MHSLSSSSARALSEGPNSGRIQTALEQVRLRLLETALTSEDVPDFLEKCVGVLCAHLPVEAAAAWQADRQHQAASICAVAGDVSRFATVQQFSVEDSSPETTAVVLQRLLNETATKPAIGEPSVAATDVIAAAFHGPEGRLIAIAVAIRTTLSTLFPIGEWLRGACFPAFDALRKILQARESLSITTSLMRATRIAIVGVSPDQECLLWNPAAEELFGWPATESLNRRLRIIPPTGERMWQEALDAALINGANVQTQLQAVRWDGELLKVDVQIVPLRQANREFPSLLLLMNDLSADDNLRRWSQLVPSAAAMLTSTAPEKTIERLLEYLAGPGGFETAELWAIPSGSIGWTRLSDCRRDQGPAFRKPAAVEFLEETRARRTIVHRILEQMPRLSRSPGVSRGRRLGIPISLDGSIEEVLLLTDDRVHDLTAEESRTLLGLASLIAQGRQLENQRCENVKLRERLVQAEKLESLGMLTTGVAHDLNNILTVIFGYCGLAESTASCELPQSIREIERAADKASLLTRQLLRFSRTPTLSKESVVVSEALAQLTPLIKGLVGPRVALRLQASAGRAAVQIARAEFDQVVLNLAANARDAISEEGQFEIQVELAEPSLQQLAACPTLRAGHCVAMHFSDSGCGMTAAIRERIFDPFFTTKPPECGTGVGLSTVREIIERAGGGLTVISEPGQGATFTIFLPRLRAELSSRLVMDRPQMDPCGTESIWLMAGDHRLRELLAKVLGLKGYFVQVIDDPANLRGSMWSRTSGDLLIADQEALGQLSGLGRKHSPKWPRRLLVLADADFEQPDRMAVFPGAHILAKPFSSLELAVAVRKTLDASTAR